MYFFVALFLFVYQVSGAVELHIYKTVTEVRQNHTGTGTFQYTFPSSEFGNIIEGTISWEGTPLTRQELYNSIESLKGALVTVKQVVSCECKVVQARVIDPNTWLLQNVKTGAYFYADSRSLEYTTANLGSNDILLTIEFKSKKFTGVLSYLMRGVTWTPNYDLLVTNDDPECQDCTIAAYANIRNNQQKEYDVQNTLLYSGDLQLVNNYRPSYNRYPSLSTAANFEVDSSIEFAGEERGFYFYSLKDDYKLRPLSTVRLPFVQVTADCKFYYKTTANIGAGEYKGVFTRHYDVVMDKFVPAGTVTVRENSVLMGQASFPDVPANFTQTITLGQDYDVRYVVKGVLVAPDSNTVTKSTITRQTYDVEVTVSNYKSKSVSGRLDFYGAPKTTIDKVDCKSISLEKTTINFPFNLNAGGSKTCKMTVTLIWG